MTKTVVRLADVNAERDAQSKRYLEFLRVPALSAGIYVLAAGAEDPQQPHTEDEIYYVLRGRARMSCEKRLRPVGGTADIEPAPQLSEVEDFEVVAGQLIFVPARAKHRFHS